MLDFKGISDWVLTGVLFWVEHLNQNHPQLSFSMPMLLELYRYNSMIFRPENQISADRNGIE